MQRVMCTDGPGDVGADEIHFTDVDARVYLDSPYGGIVADGGCAADGLPGGGEGGEDAGWVVSMRRPR